MSLYHPPFTVTDKALNLIVDIGESLGRLSADNEQNHQLKLRKINRMRTIQGSLAIEGNTLSVEQMTDIVDGKRVIAPKKEIQEVHNANLAYETLPNWQPIIEGDLLSAHRIMMKDLIKEVGVYRSTGVGVMSGSKVIHMAPPENRVPLLMKELFTWLKNTTTHPLIISSVFHYEFEFIHPFADGNGRIGRLWQTLILSKWNPIFSDIPIENLVYQNQMKYYSAIRQSTELANSSPFIEFMLDMILNSVHSLLEMEGINAGINEGIKITQLDHSILNLIKQSKFITNVQMAEKLNKATSTIERRIKVLKDNNIIHRIGAKKNGHWKIAGYII